MTAKELHKITTEIKQEVKMQMIEEKKGAPNSRIKKLMQYK